MERLFSRRTVLVAGFVATTPSVRAKLRPINPHIVSVVEGWLTLLDGERYDEAWQETSEWHRAASTPQAFRHALEGVRRPLGPPRSRTLWRESYRTSVKGRPDGHYYHVVSSTAFEARVSGAFEHVLLESEDGQWKVTGYALR